MCLELSMRPGYTQVQDRGVTITGEQVLPGYGLDEARCFGREMDGCSKVSEDSREAAPRCDVSRALEQTFDPVVRQEVKS